MSTSNFQWRHDGLLTEIPKHVDDKNIDFLAELLPWSDMLPENIRKPQKASGK